MISNTLAAAFVLLSLNFSNASTTVSNVEPIVIEAPAELAIMMSSESERKLIEDYAAPNWNLSKTEAWNLYNDGEITIIEVVEDAHYLVNYDGILEVVWEQGQG